MEHLTITRAKTSDDPRLSRGVEVVGFCDVYNPSVLLEVWQFHTPPLVGDFVKFAEGDSLPGVVGNWEVIVREWHCFDSPLTLRVICKRHK